MNFFQNIKYEYTSYNMFLLLTCKTICFGAFIWNLVIIWSSNHFNSHWSSKTLKQTDNLKSPNGISELYLFNSNLLHRIINCQTTTVVHSRLVLRTPCRQFAPLMTADALSVMNALLSKLRNRALSANGGFIWTIALAFIRYSATNAGDRYIKWHTHTCAGALQTWVGRQT